MRRPSVRSAMRAMQRNRCCHCGEPFPSLRATTVEHAIPRELGGISHPDNLAVACMTCNSTRTRLDVARLFVDIGLDHRGTLADRVAAGGKVRLRTLRKVLAKHADEGGQWSYLYQLPVNPTLTSL